MKTIVMTGVVTALVLAFVAAAVSVSVSGGGASATASGASGPFKATVSLNVGGKGVTGDLTLTQENPSAPVVIKGTIMGLSEGKHGFHVHEKGNVTGGCASTGGHFNPHGKKHGAPEDMERHAGDLGNIEADATGKAVIDISDNMISLESGSNIGIIGRAIVVHEGTDDLGKGGDTGSETTGNAGGRAGCGVIAKEGGDGDGGTGPVIEGSGTEGSTVDPQEKVEGDNSGANFGQQFQTPMIYLIILIMKFMF